MRLYLLIVIALISISKCGAVLQDITYDVTIKYENMLAAKGACSDKEQAMLDAMEESQLNHELKKLGYKSLTTSRDTGVRKLLRERELTNWCYESSCDYYCRIRYNCRRRRLMAMFSAEISIDQLQQSVVTACQNTLLSQTRLSGVYSNACRNAYAGSKCSANVA